VDWNTGCGENGGIDEHDAGHREEGGHAGEDFGAPVGAELAKFEVAFEG
jgi:hypothetical protein